MFATSYITLIVTGLVTSGIFVFGWLTLFLKGRVNPDRVPYSLASVIDFVGLPVLALLTLSLMAYTAWLHGVVPATTTLNALQRLMLLLILNLLTALRVGRFVNAYRDGVSPRVIGAPTPTNDPTNHGANDMDHQVLDVFIPETAS